MRQRRWWALVAVAAWAGVCAAASPTEARPFRGSTKWSVLLCRFSDAGTPPRTAAYYRRLVLTRGSGGLADFWDFASAGSLNLAGSVVKGWYRMAITAAQGNALDRTGRVEACRQAASTAASGNYTVPSDHLLAVVTFPSIDLFGWTGGAYLPWDIDVGGLAHEGGHGLGLEHSFSDDPVYQNASWATIGEYDDPWDVMSWANAFRVPTLTFGDGPANLNAFHRDRMGWLPRGRVVTFGADGARARTLTIAAVDTPATAGPLLVRVPFDPADLNRYYTIEFRRRAAWDGGLPADVVLLHEVRRRPDGVYASFLLRERTGDRRPVQTLAANGVRINVDALSGTTGQATVTVASNAPDRCLQGFVWREARPADRVCVTVQTRADTARDNAAAPSRRNPAGGPFGPDTCLPGFVWRDAAPGDHVCVSPSTRTRAAADNAQADARRNPARLVFGPNACKPGFVWREADDRDWVCVPPAVRQQATADNAAAASRRAPGGGAFGPDTCRPGFVWREAFPGDHVCVAPATRTAAWNDNRDADTRLRYP